MSWRGPSLLRVDRIAAHELEEPALTSIGSLVLIQEREIVSFEGLEERVPVERLQRLLGRVEVDAQDAGISIVHGGGDRGGLAAARFDPATDLVVIGGGQCL